jgi:hypothetical protein
MKMSGKDVGRYKATTTAAFTCKNCGEPPQLSVKKAGL